MKIKTCPHCGGAAWLNQRYSEKHNKYIAFVKCEVCGAQGRVIGCYEEPAAANWNNSACMEAARAWNMRTGSGADAEDQK